MTDKPDMTIESHETVAAPLERVILDGEAVVPPTSEAIARVEQHALPAVVQPAALVQHAVESGAPLETLDRLLDLQMRWEANEARKAWHAAMARFKAACPPVLVKDKHVKFKSKTGQVTSYHHTTLGGAVVAVTPYLSAEGLSVTWETVQGGDGFVTVTCVVAHELGHRERTSLTGPYDSSGLKNPIQQLGSSVSYLERYTMLSALGIATADQDDDAISLNAAASQLPRDAPPPEVVDVPPPAAKYAAPSRREPPPAAEATPPTAIDDLIAHERWSDAYEICTRVSEAKRVGAAIGSMAPGKERDALLDVHRAAVKRCADAADHNGE